MSYKPSQTRIYAPPFNFRMQALLREMNIHLESVAQCTIMPLPPWELVYPEVDLSLASHQKSSTPDQLYRALFHEHRESLPDYIPVFTDGSKTETQVGAAAVCLHNKVSDFLPVETSSYTAELHAIRLAVELVYRSGYHKSIIYSDSLSVLHGLASHQPSLHPIIPLRGTF